ncbi:helix-turn-helix domain-containing protein [Streptomyces sp. NPDC001107]
MEAGPRQRAVGAGPKHQFVFIDRLPATLVSLRHGTTHDVLACWFGVDRSTITRAVGEVRPLLAQRGCTIAPDVRLRTYPVAGLWQTVPPRSARPYVRAGGRSVDHRARSGPVRAGDLGQQFLKYQTQLQSALVSWE